VNDLIFEENIRKCTEVEVVDVVEETRQSGKEGTRIIVVGRKCADE